MINSLQVYHIPFTSVKNLSINERAVKIHELNLCRNRLGTGHTDIELCWSKRVCSKFEKPPE